MSGVGSDYRWRVLVRDFARDIDVYLAHAGEYRIPAYRFRHRLGAALTPSVLACLLYRLARWLHAAGWSTLALVVARLNLMLTRVSIHPRSRIGPGMYIPHPDTAIAFEGEAGAELRLFAGATVCASPCRPWRCYDPSTSPRLGDRVSVGAKALIQGAVTIGDGVRIGFNAVVTRNVPVGATVVARLRPRFRSATRNRTLNEPSRLPGLPAAPCREEGT